MQNGNNEATTAFNANFELTEEEIAQGETMNERVALKRINDAFLALMGSSNAEVNYQKYITDGTDGKSQLKKDADAYVSVMGTVDSNSDIVSDNLTADDCFTDGKIGNLLTGYSAMGEMGIETSPGEIAVALVVDENSNVSIYVFPLNWDK